MPIYFTYDLLFDRFVNEMPSFISNSQISTLLGTLSAAGEQEIKGLQTFYRVHKPVVE